MHWGPGQNSKCCKFFFEHGCGLCAMRGALVTGAASGIGAAISEALVHAGYNVVLFDIAPAEKTLDKLLAIRNQSALIHQGDARKIEDIRAAIKTVQDHFSPFCVLLNCAGIGASNGYQSADLY